MLIPNLKETVQKAISGESVRIPGIVNRQKEHNGNLRVQKILKEAVKFKLQTNTGM